MSIPYYVPSDKRAGVSQRWHEAKARKRMSVPVDADTVRRRALHDARGQVLREGVTFFGDGAVFNWQVRRSLSGRTDQFDLVANGEIFKTCGQRSLPVRFRPSTK